MTRWRDRSALDLTDVVRPGDGLIIGQACAEPQTLVEALVAQREELTGCGVFLGIHASGLIRPEHTDHLQLSSYCGAGHNRALASAGVLDVHPHPYSRLGALIRARHIPCDVVFLQVSPPDAQGQYSLGLAAEYLIPALETARAIVVEINDQVPWVHGARTLRESEIALAVRSSRPPAALPAGAAGEAEQRIAAHAAAFVPDGATIETGLGALPDAVLRGLADRRDLGIHSGAIGDAVADLTRRGVITNARKPVDAGRSVAGLLLGSRTLFDFARDNPALWLASSEYTHDPRVLARFERFVAINSAIEIDLTGQVNAEIVGGVYVGAVGGALDFIRAANQSPGGVSLMVLPSTVSGRTSRIVAQIAAPVATPRSEAGVFVTEWGAADLRGATLRERARRMIGIAHPQFREALEREAHALGLLGPGRST